VTGVRSRTHAHNKPSGVGWAGDVPRHWEVGNLRRFARMKTGHTPSRQEATYWEGCTIPWFTLADVWQLREEKQKYLGETKEMISEVGLANSAAELLPAGTVVLSRTASVGFSGIMPVPMATSQDYWNWICGDRLLPDYLLYLLRAMRQEIERSTMGSTHKTIYQSDAAAFTICVPPVGEQRAIVGFLDHQTARIDLLVEKKRELVERLKEKRAALISRTVTQGLPPDTARAAGLDPYPRLKPSEVRPLGRVPEHWKVRRLKSVVTRVEQGWSPECEARAADDGEWGVLKVGCVNGEDFDTREQKALPSSLVPPRELEVCPGDILMSRANTTELLGSVVLVRATRPRLLLCDKLYRLHVTGAESDFVVRLLTSGVSRYQIEGGATGASPSMKNIAQDTLRNIVFAFPPRDEQRAIADFLDRETAKIDRLVAKVEEAIERLIEYRSALITAAVTGKIDVRN